MNEISEDMPYMEIVPYRAIHYRHSSETKISYCGIWRVSRPSTIAVTNFRDVTCKRCLSLTIAKQWRRLSLKTQLSMKNSICNLVEKYG